MVKLPFVMPYFPWILYPLYWLWWLCFYIVYLPLFFLVIIFSPLSFKPKPWTFYIQRFSKQKRILEQQEAPVVKKDEGGVNDDDIGL